MRRWIIERYVIKEILAAFLIALAVLTFIFLIGTIYLFVRKELAAAQILMAIPYAIPYTLPYTVPISLLVATTLTYGRLVADNEVLAYRVAGLHLADLSLPAIALGVLLTALCFVLQDRIIPYCHYQKKNIYRAVLRGLLDLGQGENKRIELFPRSPTQRVDIFVRRFDGSKVDGLIVHKNDVAGRPMRIVAERGRFSLDASEVNVCLHLENVQIFEFEAGVSTKPVSVTRFKSYWLVLAPVGSERADRLDYYTNADIKRKVEETSAQLASQERLEGWQTVVLKKIIHTGRAELAFRHAMPLACLVFVLVGVPLPILLNQNNRLVPFFIGFGLITLTFFVPFLTGRTLCGDFIVDPWVLWLGDAITAAAGGGLLYKVFRK